MAKSKIHPQFFQTLAPGFHTHLMLPIEFFSRYIEGNRVEKEETVEVKSDATDKTWKVKMIGRSLSDGWEEFTVAQNFEIGDVIVVRYLGDLVFQILDLGPNFCDISPPGNNNKDGQNDISKPCSGQTLLKKRLYPRTKEVEFSSDDEDDMEFHRNKKVKKKNAETESFVATVTASNLRTDTLNLPQHFTSSNGFSAKCQQIVLKNERGISWNLDLTCNISSGIFHISRGWRSFCDDNGQTAGGFFMFKLVENGETPVLSFCPTESTNDRRQSDCSVASGRETVLKGRSSKEVKIEAESSGEECSSMESLIEIEEKKNTLKRSSYSLYSSSHKRSITFTLPPDYAKIKQLCLPKPFLKENGINKPGKMYMSGKDGKRWLINLVQDSKGTLKMGSGWKDFVRANSLETEFTLKLTWEDGTPVLSLCPAENTIDRGAGRGCSETNKKESFPVESSSGKKISKNENVKDDNSKEGISSGQRDTTNLRGRDPIPSNQKKVVTLKLYPSYYVTYKLLLPARFVRENNMNKHGMTIYLCREDGTKWLTTLSRDKTGGMSLVKGWKEFAEANNLKSGDSFKLELIWADATPMLSLVSSKAYENQSVSTELRSKNSSSEIQNRFVTLALTPEDDNNKEGISSRERGTINLRGRDPIPSNQKKVVTLKILPSSYVNCRLALPAQFARENSMLMPGMINLCGKDGTKWLTTLRQEKDGRLCLRKGWKEFAEANNLKPGDSFKLELIWEDATPMLSLVCSEASEKESNSTQPRSRDSSAAIQDRFVTLALTPEDVRACKLHLPSEFMKANGINKLGKITILGENKTEWTGYLLSRLNGTVALGSGWAEFSEANGVELGESFGLEFINEQNTTPVLKFRSQKTK